MSGHKYQRGAAEHAYLQAPIVDPGADGVIRVSPDNNDVIVNLRGTGGASARTMAPPDRQNLRVMLAYSNGAGAITVNFADEIDNNGSDAAALAAVGDAVQLVSVLVSGAPEWRAFGNTDGVTIS